MDLETKFKPIKVSVAPTCLKNNTRQYNCLNFVRPKMCCFLHSYKSPLKKERIDCCQYLITYSYI